MATHSSILAWRIPQTEGPGGLQSTLSQRVRHNWSDLARTHEKFFYYGGISLAESHLPLPDCFYSLLVPGIHRFKTHDLTPASGPGHKWPGVRVGPSQPICVPALGISPPLDEAPLNHPPGKTRRGDRRKQMREGSRTGKSTDVQQRKGCFTGKQIA